MFFRKRKETQSLLDSSRKSLRKAQDTAEHLKYERDIANNNATLTLRQNRILRNILKEIRTIAESNSYGNSEAILRKIKELVSTANQKTNSNIF